jgi:hypothetical protein
VLAVAFAFYIWGKTEPISAQAGRASEECNYAKQPAQVGNAPGRPIVIVCIQGAGDRQEDDADTELNQGDWQALVPLARHWVHGAVTDPVASFTGLLFLTTVLLWLATERTTLHAQRHSERELRAYIALDSIEMERPSKTLPKKPVAPKPGSNTLNNVLFLQFSNGGQTPAYDVYCHINWQPVPFGHRLADDYPFKDHETTAQGNLQPVISRDVINRDKGGIRRIPVPAALVVSMRKKQEFVYFYGHIDYVDIFGKPHKTNFCYLCTGKSTGVVFTTWHAHNECT